MELPQLDKDLFSFLTQAELDLLLTYSKKIHLKKNSLLTQENDIGTEFYVVLSGALRITKHDKKHKDIHIIGHVHPGEVIGELALIEHQPRAVSLSASKSSDLLAFDIAGIKAHPELFNKLSIGLSKDLAKRLHYMSEITVKSMHKELVETKKRNALGALMVAVLTILSVYTLSLGLLEKIRTHFPVTTIISVPLIFIIVIIMILVMKRSGYPWKTYGISLRHWKKHTIEAILFSIPLILLLMAAKWLIIHVILNNPNIPLINPKTSLAVKVFSYKVYFITLFFYILFAPLQELIARGGLQAGFYEFLTGSEKKRTWIAILLSNLIFSLPHIYTSTYFALFVIIPGIFWGWLFARQKTLVGVSVSHIIVGTWMVFVVGYQQVLTTLGS